MNSERKQTMMWKTKDGTKIRICDMSTRHIANCISLLERAALAKEQSILATVLAFPPMGEQAEIAIEAGIDEMLDEGIDPADEYPIIQNLTKELLRRGVYDHKEYLRGNDERLRSGIHLRQHAKAHRSKV